MTYLVEKEGLADRFYINSAATSREEIGNGVHHGTVAKLKKEGIPVIPPTQYVKQIIRMFGKNCCMLIAKL